MMDWDYSTPEIEKCNKTGIPFGRHRSRWEDDIKFVTEDVCCECVKWIHLAQDWSAEEDACEHCSEVSGSTRDGEFDLLSNN